MGLKPPSAGRGHLLDGSGGYLCKVAAAQAACQCLGFRMERTSDGLGDSLGAASAQLYSGVAHGRCMPVPLALWLVVPKTKHQQAALVQEALLSNTLLLPRLSNSPAPSHFRAW